MTKTDDESIWETVCSLAALEQAGMVEHMSGRNLLLIAWIDDAPWAATGLCPHNFARLSGGHIADGRLHCPRHQASFCLQTGDADDRWQIKGLRLYETMIHDGMVMIKTS